MSSNKRYFWLKLNENFFEEDTIAWIEEQENGKDYIIFYLKLALKSLMDDGRLIRYVGEKLIPYDVKALAKLTNTEIDTVKVAMNLFLEIGLVSQLDSGELYMTQIEEMVGSETRQASIMRKNRAREKQLRLGKSNNVTEISNNVTRSYSDVKKSYTEKEIEIDKEIEIEIDKELEIDSPAEAELKNTNTNKQLEEDFEELWKKHPNKKGSKKDSFKKYEKAIKSGTKHEEISKGLDKFILYCQQNKWYSPAYASTWFNQERWGNDYEIKNNNDIDQEPDMDWLSTDNIFG